MKRGGTLLRITVKVVRWLRTLVVDNCLEIRACKLGLRAVKMHLHLRMLLGEHGDFAAFSPTALVSLNKTPILELDG